MSGILVISNTCKGKKYNLSSLTIYPTCCENVIAIKRTYNKSDIEGKVSRKEEMIYVDGMVPYNEQYGIPADELFQEEAMTIEELAASAKQLIR